MMWIIYIHIVCNEFYCYSQKPDTPLPNSCLITANAFLSIQQGLTG